MSDEYILVTGGAGYIGSHTVVELIQHGYNVVVVDNLVNSSYDAIARIEYIVQKPVPFFNVDISDHDALLAVFRKYTIKGVIHFAALKAVGESTKIPLQYYENNVGGTISLLKVMQEVGLKTIVFSSSATVYGDATRFENMIPIPEHCPNDPTNPYGKTKYVIEQILKDLHSADSLWSTAILRYFNPMGAHPLGLIGEDPLGIPNNLLPYLAQVAIGRREKLSVFGNDYDSHDGTPIRDYIHVVDLARGHIAALEYLQKKKAEGIFREWNLGTGKGSTVFDVYHAFCKAVGKDLPYEVVGRRAGDVLNLTANPTRANEELGWKARLSIDDACRDLWKWTTENPSGYEVQGYKWSNFGGGYESRLHTVSVGDFSVAIANYGATIQSARIGDKEFITNFDNLDDYRKPNNPFFGATIGRVANRIGKGQFSLSGKTWTLKTNENDKTLHGGPDGFDKNFWLGPVVKKTDEGYTLAFAYVENGDQNGFPGSLETVVTYHVGAGSLKIEYDARIPDDSSADATPVHLTNHSYFTPGSGATIADVKVKSISKEYVEVDSALLPTGKFAAFEDKLVSGYVLGSDLYDNCLVVDKSGCEIDTRSRPLQEVFVALSGSHKIVFKTTEPAFQFYTGDGVSLGSHKPRCGFCIEPGRFTDAVNVEEWRKQTVLNKGDVYGSYIQYDFE